MVSVRGVQFSHRACDGLDAASGAVSHLQRVGDVVCVPAFVYGGCQLVVGLMFLAGAEMIPCRYSLKLCACSGRS